MESGAKVCPILKEMPCRDNPSQCPGFYLFNQFLFIWWPHNCLCSHLRVVVAHIFNTIPFLWLPNNVLCSLYKNVFHEPPLLFISNNVLGSHGKPFGTRKTTPDSELPRLIGEHWTKCRWWYTYYDEVSVCVSRKMITSHFQAKRRRREVSCR